MQNDDNIKLVVSRMILFTTVLQFWKNETVHYLNVQIILNWEVSKTTVRKKTVYEETIRIKILQEIK